MYICVHSYYCILEHLVTSSIPRHLKKTSPESSWGDFWEIGDVVAVWETVIAWCIVGLSQFLQELSWCPGVACGRVFSLWKIYFFTYLSFAYLGNIPGYTFDFLFSFFDSAFKFAVGVGVALVEVKVAFISVETLAGFRRDCPDFVGRSHDWCWKVDEVFPPWL